MIIESDSDHPCAVCNLFNCDLLKRRPDRKALQAFRQGQFDILLLFRHAFLLTGQLSRLKNQSFFHRIITITRHWNTTVKTVYSHCPLMIN